MCIICKIKEAGISEEALEMVETLAEFAVVTSNGLVRLKSEGALLTAEEELGLMAGQSMFERASKEEAPEGMPPDLWESMPPELRRIVQAAITNGGKLQVVNLSDIMPDESTTKH